MRTLALFVASFVLSAPATAATGVDLLWNAGPSHQCFAHVQQNDGQVDTSTSFRNNIDCPALPARPVVPACADFGLAGPQCPLWNLLTYGWNLAEREQYPGWAYWNLGGGGGAPVTMALINNARTAADPCKIREVAFSWNWPDTSFKRTAQSQGVTLGMLASLDVEVQARLDGATASQCGSLATAYVSQDVIVSFPNGAAYSIGVLLSNPGGGDLNGTDDEIFYSNVDASNPAQCQTAMVCQTLLHGDRLDPKVVQLSSQFQRYVIDFAALFQNPRYLPAPPPGLSWNDALVTHVQVVNHVRGADLRVDLRDQGVRGVLKNGQGTIQCSGQDCVLGQ